jgi:hypothetical protein
VLESEKIQLQKLGSKQPRVCSVWVHRTVRWCTGQCPMVHRTVSGVPGWRLSTGCSRDFVGGVQLKFTGLSGVHRTVRCAPDCPVCTGLSGEPTAGRANGRPRNSRATRGKANGQKGVPDCPVCTGQCPVRQRL